MFNEFYMDALFNLNVSFLTRPLKIKYGSRAAGTKVKFTVVF